jgi:hypothetical protein
VPPLTCDEPPVHPIRLDHDEAQLLTGQGRRRAVSKGSGRKACRTSHVYTHTHTPMGPGMPCSKVMYVITQQGQILTLCSPVSNWQLHPGACEWITRQCKASGLQCTYQGRQQG